MVVNQIADQVHTTKKAHNQNVIAFPSRPSMRNRLRQVDKLEAEDWISGPARLRFFLRICIGVDDDEDIGDWISIYKLGHRFACWGAARRGNVILLWDAVYGEDLGTFETIQDALGAIYARVTG